MSKIGLSVTKDFQLDDTFTWLTPHEDDSSIQKVNSRLLASHPWPWNNRQRNLDSMQTWGAFNRDFWGKIDRWHVWDDNVIDTTTEWVTSVVYSWVELDYHRLALDGLQKVCWRLGWRTCCRCTTHPLNFTHLLRIGPLRNYLGFDSTMIAAWESKINSE